MSNYISGSSSQIGARKEITFNEYAGAASVASRGNSDPLRMTSESLSATYNKLDEGVLMASKTTPEQDLGSVSVSGDVSTVLNPTFVRWLMEVSLGEVTATTPDPVVGRMETGSAGDDAVYEERTYTLAGPADELPSSGVELWRGNQGFYYSGMTVSTLTLEAPSQDFVKASISFNGTQETYISADATDEKINSAANLGSYKCTKAKLRNAAAGSDLLSQFTTDWDSCPAGQVYDVETSTLTIDNGIEETPATYCSGLYANQPGHGQRGVTIACNVPYSDSFESFRQTYYANENPAKLALMLQFASKDNFTYYPTSTPTAAETIPAHQVFIILPNISISEMSANAGGTGMIDGSFTGTALSISSTEPIKVIVRDYKNATHQE